MGGIASLGDQLFSPSFTIMGGVGTAVDFLNLVLGTVAGQ